MRIEWGRFVSLAVSFVLGVMTAVCGPAALASKAQQTRAGVLSRQVEATNKNIYNFPRVWVDKALGAMIASYDMHPNLTPEALEQKLKEVARTSLRGDQANSLVPYLGYFPLTKDAESFVNKHFSERFLPHVAKTGKDTLLTTIAESAKKIVRASRPWTPLSVEEVDAEIQKIELAAENAIQAALE